MKSHLMWWGIWIAALTSPAFGQRMWYLWPDRFDGNFTTDPLSNDWHQEATGGYDDGEPGNVFDGRYFWARGFDGVRRVYWKFEEGSNTLGTDIPAEPRMYLVETWVPAAHASAYSPLEVIMDGYDQWKFWDPNIPWDGQFGTNRQWINRNQGNQGNWVQCGLGPQVPEFIPGDPYSRCLAGGNGQIMWLKRGSVMYVMFNFAFYNVVPAPEVGVSAIRITEVFEPTSECDAPTAGGPIDLRCVGNADPLLGVGEIAGDSEDNSKFADSHDKMIKKGDGTLAAEDWIRPCSDQMPTVVVTPITRGLPPDGEYDVQLPTLTVNFKLGFEGLPVIKWRSEESAGQPFDKSRIFILNPSGPREFVQKTYKNLYLLSCKTDGNNGRLRAEAVYMDNSTSVFAFNLNDWQGTDGDPTSQAVGVDGLLRSSGPAVDGFRRVNGSAQPANNDLHDHNGTFLMYHEAALNPAKPLRQLKLYVQDDVRGPFSGVATVLAVSLDSGLCRNPVFDVVGGGLDGLEPDGAVDQRDFGVFQQCLNAVTEPGQSFNPLICGCFDVVEDDLIDSQDFQSFLNCWTGPAPAVPVSAACDN